MESAQRRREHCDDARQVVRRDDFGDRQPTVQPAERGAFTRQAISDFE
jgi:hypothetical protein